jgi:hypothetical protein
MEISFSEEEGSFPEEKRSSSEEKRFSSEEERCGSEASDLTDWAELCISKSQTVNSLVGQLWQELGHPTNLDKKVRYV